MSHTVTLENSEIIFDEITKAKNILLHCHPNPDGDSLGSVLAMYHALKGMGKNVTAIKGDSPKPGYLQAVPGFDEITEKNYFEVDLSQFDLFLILDAASPEQISKSKKEPVTFPSHLKTINIDHHVSNTKYADINLVESTIPATAQIVCELFEKWGITITKDIALCLFTGIYSDTLGFQTSLTSARTFKCAATLASIAPEFSKLVFSFVNSNTKGRIALQGLLLNSIETWFDDAIAVASASHQDLEAKGIGVEDAGGSDVANILRSVSGWNIGVTLVEAVPGTVKVSMRSRDEITHDVSKVAAQLGGGGHKAAAGVTISGSLPEAKKKLHQAMAKAYPFLAEKA